MQRKEKERAAARELRYNGWSVNKIAEELQVSKSSVCSWVRDIPQPEEFTERYRAARKADRLKKVEEARKLRAEQRKDCKVISGDIGRPLISTPPGYKGSTLINGYYVYEHRYVMELKLGRLLCPGEVVHHKDGDVFNNDPDNLEVKSNSSHVREHNYTRGANYVRLRCPSCGKRFDRARRSTHLVKRTKHSITFCSRSCIGQFDFTDAAAIRVAQKTNVIKEFVNFNE